MSKEIFDQHRDRVSKEENALQQEIAAKRRALLEKKSGGSDRVPRLHRDIEQRLIRAREEVHGGHIPIVAMTANTLEGDRDACLAAGMDGYLPKPVQLSALRAVIDRYTSGVSVAG